MSASDSTAPIPATAAVGGPRTHFTADTHLGHRLMALLRGFAPDAERREDVTEAQVAAHDEALIAAWNAAVGPEDVVWHLGDLTLKQATEIAPQLARLHGRIHLVLGNHDRAHPLFGLKAVAAQQELLAAGVVYVCSQARITLAGRGADPRSHRLPVLLSHFPYRGDHTREDRFAPWRPRDAGEVLLHGHTHAAAVAADPWDRQVHVGWDAWGRPVPEEEIRRVIASRGAAR